MRKKRILLKQETARAFCRRELLHFIAKIIGFKPDLSIALNFPANWMV
jgi:hypothetical protein